MKRKYDPIKLSIIVLLGLILFIVMGMLYSKSTRTYTWLICDSTGEYNETLKFKYSNDTLIHYYRSEYFNFKSKSDLEKWEKYFNDKSEELNLDETFSYRTEVDDLNLTVKTYINVIKRPKLYNEYIEGFELNNFSLINDVKNKMESLEYKCSLRYE